MSSLVVIEEVFVEGVEEFVFVLFLGEVFGVLINFFGCCCFMLQCLVLYVVFVVQGQQGVCVIVCEVLGLFCSVYVVLFKCFGDLFGVFCLELEEVYFGCSWGDVCIISFVELV